MNPLQAVILFSGLLLGVLTVVMLLTRRLQPYGRPFVFFLLVNLAGPIAVGMETSSHSAFWSLGYYPLFFHISFLPSAWYLLAARWGLDRSEYGHNGRRLPWLALAFSLALFIYACWARAVDVAMFGDRWYLDLKRLYLIISAFYAITVTAGLYAIEVCYRSSLGMARERIRRSFFPLVAYGIALLAMTTVAMLYRQVSDWMTCAVFLLAALVGVPLTRHYMLFDPVSNGIILTRKAVYSSLAVVLIGVYFLLVGSVGELLVKYKLDEGLFFSVVTLILMVFTFMILVVSQTLRSRLKAISMATSSMPRRGVYAEEWKEFAEEVSVTLNLDGIYERTNGLLQRLLKINHSCFVIKEPASSENYTLYSGDGIDRGIPGARLEHLADWLYRFGRPIETATLREKAPAEAEQLTECEKPVAFKAFLLAPFVARQQFLGFWGIGYHSDGRELSSDEIGFIEAAASPVALTILAARMTDELVVSREIESFHRISTFVMHDLKNSVAMLSMLMQNAEKNIQNPEFQKAALVTIGKAVDRQRKILSRLTEQKSGDKLSLEKTDLAGLIGKTLERIKLDTVTSIALTFDVPAGITVYVDPEKVGSVFDNLVMNAIEAMPDGGTLQIKVCPPTGDRTVGVAFADTGIGMDPEFIATRLYKPFSSTKPHGLGIGMYQSREIIRAHRGRLEVDSRIGEGTTFTVFLPGDK
ncbi:MAG: ATP-binding protein [candidate division Zixibacteria bacterium]|nr:ATP-binding protein [candidate division Zixibacteria bacterium]